MKCAECKADLPDIVDRRQRYCDLVCRNAFNNRINHTRGMMQDKYRRRKAILVQNLGGKCIKCGYDQNYAALSFHHRDSSTKLFAITAREIANKSFESVSAEVAKCDLLCANCHMAEHYPYLNKEYFSGVAQRPEQQTHNLSSEGSSPSTTTKRL